VRSIGCYGLYVVWSKFAIDLIHLIIVHRKRVHGLRGNRNQLPGSLFFLRAEKLEEEEKKQSASESNKTQLV
jgi:heme exporter protein D